MEVKVSLHMGVTLILGLCAALFTGCGGNGEPHRGETLCREAEVFLADQRVPEAMIVADAALSAPGAGDSVKARAYMILSLCHAAAHNSTSALVFAEMALACDPDDEDIQAVYADALIDGQRYDECVAFLDTLPAECHELRRKRVPALSGMGAWQRVLDMTDSIGVERLTDTELLHRAYSLARLGRLSSRTPEWHLLDLDNGSWGYARDELHLLRDIYAACGESKRAAEMEGELIAKQDSLIASMAESKIYEDVYNYEHTRHREEEMRAHRSPKFMRNLERTVNLYRDNVIGRLRLQIPGLGDSDMAIVLYAAAGLTPRVMCLLTGLSSPALYNRKYRLKKRISASGAVDTPEFMWLLEG